MSPQHRGITFQYQIAGTLSAAFPCLPSDAIRFSQWQQRGDDILLSPEARKLIPFCIECKYDKSGSYRAAFNQANRRSLYEPLAIMQCNRRHMTPAEKKLIHGKSSRNRIEANHQPIAVVAGSTLRTLLGDAKDDFDIMKVTRCNLYSTFLEQQNLVVVIDSPRGQLAAIHLQHFLTYLRHQ